MDPPPSTQTFPDMDAGITYCQSWASQHGYALVIRSTERREKGGKRCGDVYVARLACDKSRKLHQSDRPPVRNRLSVRTNCPFSVNVINNVGVATWRVDIRNATHNHDASIIQSEHTHLRRQERKINPEINATISANHSAGVTTYQTLIALQNKYPDLLTTRRDIQNAYATEQRIKNQGYAPIQAALLDLDDTFLFRYTVNENSQLIRLSLFPKEGVRLLCLFPSTLIVDVTYSVNKYKLFMLNIVGLTATNQSFLIGSTLLEGEDADSALFSLDHLKAIYTENGLPLPISITTDRARALINACKAAFPGSQHVICAWHVNRAVRAEIKRFAVCRVPNNIPKPEKTKRQAAIINQLTQLWEAVQYAKTVDAASKANLNLNRECQQRDWSDFIVYLDDQWRWCQESFITAYTDRINHFGNASSNRAEGIHRAVKITLPHRNLGIQGLCNCLKRWCQATYPQLKLDLANQKQRRDIRLAFYWFLAGLHTVISRFALNKVLDHCRQWNLLARPQRGIDPCTHVFSTVYGLPCAHVVQQHINNNIPLSVDLFHAQWRLDRLAELPTLGRFDLLRDPPSRAVETRNRPIRRQRSHWEIAGVSNRAQVGGDLRAISQNTEMSQIYQSRVTGGNCGD